MDFNILGVVTFLVGVIFVYSGVKAFYPQDVIKHALGGPEPKKIERKNKSGSDSGSGGSGDPNAAGGADGSGANGAGSGLGSLGQKAKNGLNSIGPAIASQNGGNNGHGALGAVSNFAKNQFKGIAAGARSVFPKLFGK